jgi:hypothetical protein
MGTAISSPTESQEAQRSRISRLLELEDFEVWRVRGLGLLIFAAVSLVAYWVLWLADRSLITSDHSARYIAFEQAFPLADGWLLAALLVAAIQLWRRRGSAVVWMFVIGGAAVYLCAMDVLYDLQHDIYAKGQGGAIELVINLATAALGIGVMRTGWRFRHRLLESPGDS